MGFLYLHALYNIIMNLTGLFTLPWESSLEIKAVLETTNEICGFSKLAQI